ncbi:MAG: cytochrome c biogenesis protein ResB [Mariprofundaceae bacterium]|nr:cytochrome c biogenesis protein ResB [Mariprofundaceae bacterium]
MPLAIVLLMVLAIASMVGTVLLQNQEQSAYLDQFGPVWYWVFRSLGMFDMYHAWWFIGLLGFLMTSLTFCLWHNVPRMLKEMRTHKVTLAERSWERMPHSHAWTLTGVTAEQVQAKIESISGWRWRSQQGEGRTHFRGDKGSYHKLGYIFVHGAILVVLIGGWMSVQFGFRGNMAVPVGQAESKITYLKGTGVEGLEMPFQVRCNRFDIDFYPNGMPKEFLSNLTIIDGGKEVLTSDIIVNEPLYYKGVRIYQASFGDGGSDIKLKLFRLDGSRRIDTMEGKIYQTYTDAESGISIEFTDFKPFNVENMAGRGEVKQFQDIGPAVDFILRGPGLKPVKVRSFLNPFMANGQNQGSLMMVSLTGDARDFQSFFLGPDLTSSREWELFHAFGKKASGAADDGSIEAFKAAISEVYGDKRPEDFQDLGIRTLQGMSMLPNLPWPFIPVLDDFEQHYYTGLQLAQDPGMTVVWIGSAFLVFGLCIMLYVSHRKVWLVFEPQGKGLHLRLAGMSNRNAMAFAAEFNQLLRELEESLGVSEQGEQL